MTIDEIKKDYIEHKCLYFDTVDKLGVWCNMTIKSAEELVDSWSGEWYDNKFGKSP